MYTVVGLSWSGTCTEWPKPGGNRPNRLAYHNFEIQPQCLSLKKQKLRGHCVGALMSIAWR